MPLGKLWLNIRNNPDAKINLAELSSDKFPSFTFLWLKQNSVAVKEASSPLQRTMWKEHMQQRKTGLMMIAFATSSPLKEKASLHPRFYITALQAQLATI